jgi:hypothetical protein
MRYRGGMAMPSNRVLSEDDLMQIKCATIASVTRQVEASDMLLVASRDMLHRERELERAEYSIR